MEESLIKKLVAAAKCSICGQSYKAGDIDILGHEDDLWILNVFCPVCDTQYLVAAVIREDKTPELITDLTELEIGKFMNIDRPMPDDMLDMHTFLKDFDGDFSQLFN